MNLTAEQQDLLNGAEGRAVARAMETLVAYGNAFGAARLAPIVSAHLAGSFGILSFEAYLKILDKLVAGGARFKVPTTVNPRPGEEQNALTRGTFAKQQRLERRLEALGVTPNYSCVCYDGANVPSAGDPVAWAESSAVQYANSVLGARTNRNSLVIDVCSSVTGFTPEFGYLLDENRRGQLLVKLAVQRMDASALGFILGREVVNRVPVVEHYDFDAVDLKNMGGAMAASGAVALFHVEGVTPEAPDMKTAFHGAAPERTMTVTQADLDALREGARHKPDMVVFGCPQMTLEEALDVGRHFEGARPVRVPAWFCMAPAALREFKKTAVYGHVRSAGVEVHPWCPLAALSVRLGKKRVLTSSGKLYYYLDGTVYGNRDDCLHACGVS